MSQLKRKSNKHGCMSRHFHIRAVSAKQLRSVKLPFLSANISGTHITAKTSSFTQLTMIMQTKLEDVQQTREGVVSEYSVGGAGAAKVGVAHNGAPPESRHAAMLWGGKSIWVQTGVIIMQRRTVCLS